jgi:CubicO group peptidase (beta-lactamase class C family)
MSAPANISPINTVQINSGQINSAQGKNPEEAFKDILSYMQEGIEEGVSPGMVLLVGRMGEIVFNSAVGRRYTKRLTESNEEDPKNIMSADMVFDVASLTSLVVTTTMVMKLVENGKLKLEDKVSRFVQGFSVLGKSQISIGHLLSHTSGIAAWAPIFEELVKANSGARLGILTSKGAKDYVVNSLIRMPLKYEPGTKQVYSELGFILLGYVVEMLTGLTLDKAAQKYIFQPLNMKSSSYIDLSMIKRRGIHPVTELIAPTEDCAWRKRILCGEVHEDNAWAMGGVAGHSGLFTNAYDLHIFATEILASWANKSDFLKRPTLSHFWRAPDVENSEGWRFGWDTVSRENGLEESQLSKNAVGACGFSGCSVWLEPDKAVNIILMTNRIHPSRSNKKIISFRAGLHSLVIDALKAL